jgi:hypothetical protein
LSRVFSLCPKFFSFLGKIKRQPLEGSGRFICPGKALRASRKSIIEGLSVMGRVIPFGVALFPRLHWLRGKKGGLARGKSEAGDDQEGKHAKS